MKQYSFLALRRRRNVLLRTTSSTVKVNAARTRCQHVKRDENDNPERQPVDSLRKNLDGNKSTRLALIMPHFAG